MMNLMARVAVLVVGGLALAGCGGPDKIDYPDESAAQFRAQNVDWLVYDQPDHSRLMLTPAGAEYYGHDMVRDVGRDLEFGNIPKGTYRLAVTAWLKATRRPGCSVTDGDHLERTRFEFSYRCEEAAPRYGVLPAVMPPAPKPATKLKPWDNFPPKH